MAEAVAPGRRERPGWPGRGLLVTGGASALVAVLGLLALVAVARWHGPVEYAAFAVLWGLFFGLGGAFAGLQQEVTRSVAVGSGRPGRRLAPLVPLLALPVAAAGVLLAARAGSDAGTPVSGAAPLVLGAGLLGLAGLTFVSGALAAAGDWPGLAVLLVVDAALRTGAVVALAAAGPADLLPLGIAAGAVAWPVVLGGARYRRAVRARSVTSPRGFALRSLAAMAGTGCAALMVVGLPALVGAVRGDRLGAGAGAALGALTLLRSGPLVLLYGLRPVILRAFLPGPGGEGPRGSVVRVWGWCAVVGGGWTVAAVLAGPFAVRLVLGAGFTVTRGECAALALGALGLALLVVSGLALVARDRHAASFVGWAVALAATAATVAVPEDARASIVAAALAGPWAGVAMHAWLLGPARAGT